MKSSNPSRGATLVEFALVLPILLLLLLSAMDFGRAYQIYQTMTNAAREGARYGVAPYPGTDTLPSNVSDVVCSHLASGHITCGDGPQRARVTVATSTVTVNAVPAAYTTVTVTYTGFRFLYFAPVDITADSVMRNENN